MLSVTKVISTSLSAAKRLVKVLRLGKSDVQEITEVSPFGIDGNPLKDMIAIYGETGVKGKNYIIGYINRNQIAEPGELRLYSLDAEKNEKTYIHLKKDATIEIFGDDDNMVRFSKLEIAFNQLKTDHNNLVVAFNIDATILATMLALPFTPQIPSTADIAPAKIKEIKTKAT